MSTEEIADITIKKQVRDSPILLEATTRGPKHAPICKNENETLLQLESLSRVKRIIRYGTCIHRSNRI